MSLQISQKPMTPSFQGRNVVIKNSAREVIESYDANELATELKQIADESGLKIILKGFTKTFSETGLYGFSHFTKEKYLKAIVSKDSLNPFKHREKVVENAKRSLLVDSIVREVKERIKLL